MIMVYVEWDDSAMLYGWQSSQELSGCNKVAKCCTVGFLVAEDSDSLALAFNASIDGRTSPFGEILSIPQAAITKRMSLKTIATRTKADACA